MSNKKHVAFSMFIGSMLLHFSVFSQNRAANIGLTNVQLPDKMVAKSILSYKESMISSMDNFVLTHGENGAKLFKNKDQKNKFQENAMLPIIRINDIVAAYNKYIWVVGQTEMSCFSLITHQKTGSYPLPENARFSAVEIGFDNTLFCLDAVKNQVHRFHKGDWKIVCEGEQIAKSNCMILSGRNLYIGTENSLKVLNIGNGKLDIVAENTPNIKAITSDYYGNLVTLTDESVVKYSLKGEKELLPIDVKNAVSLTVNTTSNTLFIVNSNGKIGAVDYFKLTNDLSGIALANNKRTMKPFETKDMTLVGSEYLYYSLNEKSELIEGGDDGFYPQKGVYLEGEPATKTPNPTVMACAEKSYEAFKKWSANLPQAFQATIKQTPPMFWLMVNDYSEIKQPIREKTRDAGLWYWKRNPAVLGRVPGYWKWEATVTQEGKCTIPNAEQAIKYLENHVKTTLKQ
jgi:ribosomal protein L30E